MFYFSVSLQPSKYRLYITSAKNNTNNIMLDPRSWSGAGFDPASSFFIDAAFTGMATVGMINC